MKQIGTVVETYGNIAKIECDRRSACDMCENSEGCTVKCQKAYTRALNPLNAQVGDTVEIEAEDGRTFVIHDASSDQPSVLYTQCEGIGRPSVPGGNNIHVGDSGKVPLPQVFPDGGVADI